MAEKTKHVSATNYLLQPGFIFVPSNPTVISVVLGSCVAVSLYDRKQKAGGMNHFQLPVIRDREKTTAVYGNVAMIALLRLMLDGRAKKKHLEAQIFGGAYNPDINTHDIGDENVKVAKTILTKNKIPIVSEDVRGQVGRKVVFNTSTNEVIVLKVEKIRKKDWYPYDSDR
jgi:chemotaxis protein CheD